MHEQSLADCVPTGGTWYLLQCKPRQDQRALENLQRQNYLCFQPVCHQERLVRGVRKIVEEPLFPGYLFIQLEAGSNWAPLRSTRGVARVVSFGGQPRPVADDLIARLRAREAGQSPRPLLLQGETVRIEHGPLAGLEAIFLCTQGEQRVVLLMNLLQREQRVQLPLEMIRKL